MAAIYARSSFMLVILLFELLVLSKVLSPSDSWIFFTSISSDSGFSFYAPCLLVSIHFALQPDEVHEKDQGRPPDLI